jgi:hypothetical protein
MVGQYGEFMVRPFSQYEELEEIVRLAAQPIPQRPDGIVVVAKYTSASRADCRVTEADYDRLARSNPATIFLRCFEDAATSIALLQSQVNVQTWPTYDIFYGGNQVARIVGNNIAELESALQRYQLWNSNLDLFSEQAVEQRRRQNGTSASSRPDSTPRTTNRFIPGYDWNKNSGAFDEQGAKAQSSFEDMFGNWLPNIDDDK